MSHTWVTDEVQSLTGKSSTFDERQPRQFGTPFNQLATQLNTNFWVLCVWFYAVSVGIRPISAVRSICRVSKVGQVLPSPVTDWYNDALAVVSDQWLWELSFHEIVDGQVDVVSHGEAEVEREGVEQVVGPGV